MPIHDSIHDDEQFERYLKQFRPLAPDALPTVKHRSSRRTFVLAAWAAVAAVAIIALLILYPRSQQSTRYRDTYQNQNQRSGTVSPGPQNGSEPRPEL